LSRAPKAKLGLPDLDQSKAAVIGSLRSPESQRGYTHAIDEFIEWYCSEPRLSFSRTVVLRYRIHARNLAPGTINVRLAAVRRLAYEAADAGLLSPELAAGIRCVKGVKKLGVLAGNLRIGNFHFPAYRLYGQVNFGIGKHHGIREERGIVPIATPRFSRLRRNLSGRMIPFMKKAILLSAAAFSLYTSSPHCAARQLYATIPTIYLSDSEAAKAKQAVQDYKSAQERNNRALTAWRNFYDSYQASHPDLQGLQFASDFRFAFSRKNINGRSETIANLATVELSPEERQKAESLNQEMLEARRLADQAQKNWRDYWQELVFDHVPQSREGFVVSLPSGKSGTFPQQWANGVVFTPDFRIAAPFQ
jgi:hypothetical protein